MRRRKSELKSKSIVVTVSICGILCLAGIGYVWAKRQLYTLGKEMKTLEVQLDQLRSDNEALQGEYAVLCTPRELERRAKELHLGLILPPTDQIIRLDEPGVQVRQRGEPKIYASRAD